MYSFPAAKQITKISALFAKCRLPIFIIALKSPEKDRVVFFKYCFVKKVRRAKCTQNFFPITMKVSANILFCKNFVFQTTFL
jgi:hypothetical protein